MICKKCGEPLSFGGPPHECKATEPSVCSNDLLPCPFCGGKAEVVESGPSGKDHVTHWQARCSSILSGCIGAEIDTWRCTKDDATKAWNTRAGINAELTCTACAYHGPQEDCEVCGGEVTYIEKIGAR